MLPLHLKQTIKFNAMRKLLFSLIFSMLSVVGFSQFVLDFETAGGYTTSSAEHTDGYSDYATRTDGSDISANYYGQQGSYFFAAQDVDADGFANPDTLLVTGIDVSSYTNPQFYVMLASYMGGWDATDSVYFQYSADGGTTWTTILGLQNDGSDYNGPVYIDTDGDGVGDVDAGLSATFKPFTVDLNFPSGTTTIDLRVIISLNSGSEDIAFDYIRIGDPIAATKLNVTANPTTSYDGNTTLTINTTDDGGAPVAVASDVTVNLSTNGTGTLTPATATIAAGTYTTSVAVSYDTYEAVTITAADAAGVLASGTVDVTFTEFVINSFPYVRDFDANQDLGYQGWSAGHDANLAAIDWYVTDYNGDYFVKFSNYDSGNKPATKAWYISPKIDASTLSNPVVSFQYLGAYDAETVPLTIYYSTDYAGDFASATWTKIGELVGTTSYNWYFSGQFAIPAEANVYVAFVVDVQNDGVAPTWEVDQIYIGEKQFIMTNAYPVAADKIAVEFSDVVPTDGSVTADQFALNGTAATALDIDANDNTKAIVTLASEATGDAVADNFTFANPQTGATDFKEMYAGILPISTLNPASGDSIKTGTPALIAGTVVYVGDRSVILYGDMNDFGAVEVYDANYAGSGVAVGDSVLLTGFYTDYNGYTEFTGVLNSEKLGTGTLSATPVTVDPALFLSTDPRDPAAAAYIARKVEVDNVVIDSYDSYSNVYAVINSNGDKIIFDDRYYNGATDWASVFSAAKKYNVSGFVTYAYGNYRINPLDENDIQEVVAAGVNDVNSSVKVYPNPATDYIMLSTQANQVDIYSTTGQLIKSVQNTNRVDVSSLQAGTYMARIYTDEGMVVKPFIKK